MSPLFQVNTDEKTSRRRQSQGRLTNSITDTQTKLHTSIRTVATLHSTAGQSQHDDDDDDDDDLSAALVPLSSDG